MVLIAPLLNALAAVAQVSPAVHDVSPNALAARQTTTSDIPSQCQSSCQVINTMTACESSADSLTCICASSIGTQLQSCMICVTKAEPSVQSEAQSSLDSWNEACSGNLSLSGGSTSTSTGSSGGSATTASSPTTTSGSTTPSSSSSTSNPLSGKTGGAVGMNAVTGAFSLVVAIACGILIL